MGNPKRFTRSTRSGLFVPTVKLDPSQVRDARPKPPAERAGRTRVRSDLLRYEDGAIGPEPKRVYQKLLRRGMR